MSEIIYLTRIETFSAAHRLHSVHYSDDENVLIYGKCNNKYGHGHNYVLHVTISGKLDYRSGMLMNITDLKSLIKTEIIDELDHKHLDMDVEYFRNGQIVSTTENLCIYIWKKLEKALNTFNNDKNQNQSIKLYEIKIHETDKNTVTYRGE
ncbi:unnamed protein product [Didymodactylos carnosus]|uniref:6-pyruvoyltetrahydropterin synthase n=1 Tax=Didymodactylos carnosus TaxID=1234261 RepID=A0A814DD53_9BILA|nr:unnamed protein product [Didymodactylos carnosus]CAF3729497.1 unnamed protein product [Didymodactylos carnosus]